MGPVQVGASTGGQALAICTLLFELMVHRACEASRITPGRYQKNSVDASEVSTSLPERAYVWGVGGGGTGTCWRRCLFWESEGGLHMCLQVCKSP